MSSKRLKNEAELLKLAIQVGMFYAERRGVVKFDATDSASEKIEYLYRLLVHDQQIHPLAKDQINELNMKHKLALWAAKRLPPDHPLVR